MDLNFPFLTGRLGIKKLKAVIQDMRDLDRKNHSHPGLWLAGSHRHRALYSCLVRCYKRKVSGSAVGHCSVVESMSEAVEQVLAFFFIPSTKNFAEILQSLQDKIICTKRSSGGIFPGIALPLYLYSEGIELFLWFLWQDNSDINWGTDMGKLPMWTLSKMQDSLS